MKSVYFRLYRFASHVIPILLTLLLFACAPDLIVKNVHKEQFISSALVMKGTVKNQGTEKADESQTTIKRKYNWSDSFDEIAKVPTPALDPGNDIELPLWVFSPTSLPEPGSCMHIQVCADADNAINEIIENNNCLLRSFMNQRYCPSCDNCCNQTLPQFFDWRNVNGTNWLTAVKDQGSCGSCWAFSAIATIEAKNNTEKDASQINSINLSEQQLVSCPNGGGNCNGGWPHISMQYIRDHGVVNEITYPYTETNSALTTVQCDALDDPAVPYGTNPPMWRVDSRHRVTGNTEDEIKRALMCHGPLSVVSTNWSHAVLLVGWADNIIPQWIASMYGWSRDVWIIKNSWGTDWGGNGYGVIPSSGHPYSDIVDIAWYVQGVTKWP